MSFRVTFGENEFEVTASVSVALITPVRVTQDGETRVIEDGGTRVLNSPLALITLPIPLHEEHLPIKHHGQ